VKKKTWEEGSSSPSVSFLQRSGAKSLGILFSPADKGLDTFLKLAAWQQHTMVAPAAFEADIGP
jgi:hypothetical protein